MKNITKFLIALCLLGYRITEAQNVVTTGGNYHSNANGSISYTIGEPITETYTKGSTTLTQGMQQITLTVTAINELFGLDYSITAFPNPATELVKLKIGKGNISGMKYQLFDITGKLIQNKKLEVTETEIPFGHLPPSTYLIKVIDDNKEVKTFKIVKK